MARTSWIVRSQRVPKFSSRKVNRCLKCGRKHAFMRRFGMCRICFREMAWRGEIPGLVKASW